MKNRRSWTGFFWNISVGSLQGIKLIGFTSEKKFARTFRPHRTRSRSQVSDGWIWPCATGRLRLAIAVHDCIAHESKSLYKAVYSESARLRSIAFYLVFLSPYRTPEHTFRRFVLDSAEGLRNNKEFRTRSRGERPRGMKEKGNSKTVRDQL